MTTKLTLVVGAGTGPEIEVATGDQLKARISDQLFFEFDGTNRVRTGNGAVYDAIVLAAKAKDPQIWDVNAQLIAARHIVNALPQATSIDSFIEAHKGNRDIELCGKIAIVRSILQEERKSFLWFDPAQTQLPGFNRLTNTWLHAFFQLLVENATLDVVRTRLSRVAIINFNYDRCIEQFLFFAFQNYYGVSVEVARNLIALLEIYHPYGTVGSLPWSGKPTPTLFGRNPSAAAIVELTTQIKTFSEGTDPGSSEILAIRSRLLNSHTILWLGFAFHPQNMDLLLTRDSQQEQLRHINCFGTAVKISDSNRTQISKDISGLLSIRQENVFLRSDLECAPLLREYWRRIAFKKIAPSG